MSSSSDRDDPLAPVLRPLRYAAKNDYANLAVVRGLEAAVRAAAQKLGPVVDSRTRDVLNDALGIAAGIDALDPAAKKARVAALLERLGEVAPPVDTASAQPSRLAPRDRPPTKTTRATPKREEAQNELFAPAVTARRVRKAAPRVEAAAVAKRVAMAEARPGHRLVDIVGVGPKTAERLAAQRIETVQDALFFLPIRYEDRTQFVPIAELEEGTSGAVRGRVSAATMRMMGRRKRMFEVAVRDETGTLSCRFFRFSKNQMEAKFARGVEVVVFGKVTKWGAMKQMVHPEMTVFSEDDAPAPEGVLPVYPEIQAVPKRTLRKIVAGLAEAASDAIVDPLPVALRDRLALPPLAAAVRRAHLPAADDSTHDREGPLERMRQRLVFDELFYMQLALAQLRADRDAAKGIANVSSEAWSALAKRLLPFELTNAQARAITTIDEDLRSTRPMNRLLLGDVGSGKTAVAFLAAALVERAGRQTALLAPTEILAEQHFENALRTLEPHGFDVRLLTGATKAAARNEILVGLRSKTVDLLVGTHAMLEPGVRFADLGLAIVDEQHRFGVEQRAALTNKREDATCDVLVMTATPIPRTLSLTAYGDLRVTIIDELPPGRSPTETQVFRLSERERAYRVVAEELEAGRQAYVVYPLVETSEKLDLSAATDAVETLRERFAPRAVGLLHGRMKSDEKAAVMARFVANEIAVLVSTTVVEVGVDVKNATVMVVEHAERFGLSQLHQLRGRVGRGGNAGRCVLLVDDKSKDGLSRARVLAETTSGFEVAERDLELRGAGEVLGTRQSGLSDLQLADLVHDAATLEVARAEAFQLLESDPRLDEPEHEALARELERRFEGRLSLAKVG